MGGGTCGIGMPGSYKRAGHSLTWNQLKLAARHDNCEVIEGWGGTQTLEPTS